MSVCLRIGLENDPFLEQDDAGREMLGLKSQTRMALLLGRTFKWRPKSFQLVGFAWPKEFQAIAIPFLEKLLPWEGTGRRVAAGEPKTLGKGTGVGFGIRVM